MEDLIKRINLWKMDLEKQDANYEIMEVFDKMCVYMIEQHNLIIQFENFAKETLEKQQSKK